MLAALSPVLHSVLFGVAFKPPENDIIPSNSQVVTTHVAFNMSPRTFAQACISWFTDMLKNESGFKMRSNAFVITAFWSFRLPSTQMKFEITVHGLQSAHAFTNQTLFVRAQGHFALWRFNLLWSSASTRPSTLDTTSPLKHLLQRALMVEQPSSIYSK